MADQNLSLPPGWAAEWDLDNQRYLFIETATGRRQWEHPSAMTSTPMDMQDTAPSDFAATRAKRRQYAADQSQTYYGTPEPTGYGPSGAPGYSHQPQVQGFQPGVGEQHPQGGYEQPGYAQPGYPQENASYGTNYGAEQPQYQGSQPQYQDPQPQYQGPQHGVNAMTEQFGYMHMGPKPAQLFTTNLLTEPVDPNVLLEPPPGIRLPPNVCITTSPSANADSSYQRTTMHAIPTTSALLYKSKLPLAIVTTPYRSLNEGEPPVPLQTDGVILRCRRCKMYLNPYVSFVDGGNRWKCCICNMTNDVPQDFDWNRETNQPADRWARPELNHAVVDFIAPTEYMIRPPQPTVYAFLVDVSHSAVQSGMVATAARTILESLDRIPNEDQRTKVAIIGYDSSLYFFSLSLESAESSMLVVSDIEDVFLPQPNDILVNLLEARASLENLLTNFNTMFQEASTVGSALGPAMQAAYKLVSSIGGKIVVLTSSLPNLGDGSLKVREDPKMLGTSKESSLLISASSFYKQFAIECSRSQVSVDMFLFSATYQDVATLGCLPHYTSGQCFFYPAFNAARSEDVIKFANEFSSVLAQPILLEAVMRIRATRGLRLASFHGNFFVRSTDLLNMPAVPQDHSYAIELEIEDTIQSSFVVIQTAILHSTCFGERRCRVVTTALPTTTNISDMYASVDQIALATLLANKAVERSISSKLEDARDAINNKMIELLTTYKSNMSAAGAAASGQLAIPANMRLLPVLLLGLLKNVGIRSGSQIPSDLRAQAQGLLTTLPAQMLIPYLYPAFYSLHNMPDEAGTPGEEGVILPPALPLTSERLERHGLFLIEDGQQMFLWVGRDAVPRLLMDVFDRPNYESLQGGKATLPLLDNDFSPRVNAVVAKVRSMRRGPYYPTMYIVKDEGDPALRLWALSCLIQDRTDAMPSYQQWLGTLRDKVAGTSY